MKVYGERVRARSSMMWSEAVPWKAQAARVTPGGLGDLNRPLSVKEIESIINKLLKKDARGLMGSL